MAFGRPLKTFFYLSTENTFSLIGRVFRVTRRFQTPDVFFYVNYGGKGNRGRSNTTGILSEEYVFEKSSCNAHTTHTTTRFVNLTRKRRTKHAHVGQQVGRKPFGSTKLRCNGDAVAQQKYIGKRSNDFRRLGLHFVPSKTLGVSSFRRCMGTNIYF